MGFACTEGVQFNPPERQVLADLIYMQIYVERCLFDAIYTGESAASPFTEPLHSLLVQIVDLVEQFPPCVY